MRNIQYESVEIIVGTSHEDGFILFISSDGFIFDHILCPRLSFVIKILHLMKITISVKLSESEMECVVPIAWTEDNLFMWAKLQ
jgi:hypothetical protein